MKEIYFPTRNHDSLTFQVLNNYTIIVIVLPLQITRKEVSSGARKGVEMYFSLPEFQAEEEL